MNPDTRNILQWNCRGYFANNEDIRDLTQRFNPTVLSLQELIMGQRTRLYLPGYNSSYSHGRGGAGLLIRNDIPNSTIQLQTTLQAVAATVYLGKQYTVCSLYLPPQDIVTNTELQQLIEQLPEPRLILGDLNARDQTWGDHQSNQRARLIKNIIQDYEMTLLNTGEFTHYHIQTDSYSCIDLSIVSIEACLDFSWNVITPTENEQYDSDHYPIIITKIDDNRLTPRKVFNLKKANWEDFKRLSEMYIDVENLSIHDRNAIITNHIMETAKRTIPYGLPPNKKKLQPYWNNECERAKLNKKRALRRWKRTRLLRDKIEYNKLKAIQKCIINKTKKNSWENFVSSINSSTPLTKVWTRVAKIAGKYNKKIVPTIKDRQGNIQTDPEIVAEMLGESFASFSSGEAYTERFNRLRQQLERNHIDFEEEEIEYNDPFSIAQLKDAINDCKDTSPGEDEVHYKMIKHLHPTALQEILILYNEVWMRSEMPEEWKTAIIIPIKKEGKNGSDPTHYRPISLTSCLCKLMEKMAKTRLCWYLEKNNIISLKQFGFKKNHSTTDPLLIFEHDIRQAFSRKRMILAVSFDLEKAYDTTWRWGLMRTMKNIGLRGKLPKFYEQLLKNRSIKVCIGTYLSRRRILAEGLPQGSVSSCELFKVQINDLAQEIPNDIKFSLYVDDLLIYFEGNYLPTMERRIQNAIDRISRWAEEHGYKFSNTKTHSILFNRRGERQRPSLKIYGQDITMQKEIKFLGLTFDTRLTWSKQVQNVKNHCTSPINLLRYLSHHNWGADKKTLTLLYKSLVQSRLTYACDIYCTNQNIIEALNKIQNEGLRIISGAFKSSPIASLQVDCGIPPFDLQVLQSSCKHYIRLKQDPESHSLEIIREAIENRTGWIFRRQLQTVLGDNCEDEIKVMSGVEEPPPWRIIEADICDGIQIGTSTDIHYLASSFREHAECHKEYKNLYTDGSKNENGVGSAVIAPFKNMVDSHTLQKDASIFSAEALAIVLAMRLIDYLPNDKYIIYSDSRSVLMALKQFQPKNPLISKIREWINYKEKTSNTKIKLCWIPAHVGLQGNEQVDVVAKAATTQIATPIRLPYRDYYSRIKGYIKNTWQSRWDLEIENKLHKIRPLINRWQSSYHKKRKYETVLTRLRIGHCNFSHVHLMKKEPQPRCCGVPLTVKHALVECMNHQQIFNSMYPDLRSKTTDEKMTELIGDINEYKLEKLITYLRRTNLLNKI